MANYFIMLHNVQHRATPTRFESSGSQSGLEFFSIESTFFDLFFHLEIFFILRSLLHLI